VVGLQAPGKVRALAEDTDHIDVVAPPVRGQPLTVRTDTGVRGAGGAARGAPGRRARIGAAPDGVSAA